MIYAKKLLVIVCNICLTSMLYGQSTTTLKGRLQTGVADSVSLVNQFVRNAPAIADSLVRYEFLKTRSTQLRADVQHCQAEKLSLRLDLVHLRSRLDSTNRINRTQAIQNNTRKERLARANLERWGWRGLALLGLYLLVR